MQTMKHYNVTIGQSSFTLEAINLKAAKTLANFHKRMNKIKGQTSVKLKR